MGRYFGRITLAICLSQSVPGLWKLENIQLYYYSSYTASNRKEVAEIGRERETEKASVQEEDGTCVVFVVILVLSPLSLKLFISGGKSKKERLAVWQNRMDAWEISPSVSLLFLGQAKLGFQSVTLLK